MQRSHWQLGLLGGLVALIAYVATLTHVHTYDAYSYAATIQTKGFAESLHPHHLLYGPLGKVVYTSVQALGYSGSALLPLQLVNALAGSCGVAFLIVLLGRTVYRPVLALLGGGITGFAFAWWRYAVEVEVYTLATLFLIIGMLLLQRLHAEPTQLRSWMLLGLVHAAAIMFHQTNVLWAVPVLTTWHDARWSNPTRAKRLKAIASYAAVGAGLTIGVYAIAMYWVSDFDSWAEAQTWFFEYATTGFWGGTPSFQTLVDLGNGWSNTWLPAYGGIILLLLGATFAWRWSLIATQFKPLILISVSWLIPYMLFFSWWEAANIEFWIACIPPVAVLFILALATLPTPLYRPALAAATFLVSLLVLVNGGWLLINGSQRNDQDRAAVEQLVAAGTPGDLYLVPNGLQSLYLIHEYQHPNTLPLSLSTGDWPTACATIQSVVERTLSAGYAVWIAQEFYQPPAALVERYQLEPDAVQACMQPFLATITRDLGTQSYTILEPLPGGKPQWEWNTWTAGWLARDARTSSWNKGWMLTPAADLHLVSPPLNLEATDWSTLEVTLATDIPNTAAQFFWIAPGQTATEERSLQWPLFSDGQPHTYRFDLSELSAWTGPIERLRLDPVAAGDGSVTLQQLHVLP